MEEYDWKTQQLHHAYQSVGINFSTEPTKELINLMKERAKEFIKLDEFKYIKIEMFRLVEIIIKERELLRAL